MKDDLLRLVVDDEPFVAAPGERVIEVLNRAKIKIPQICFHESLGALESCDTCMVEIDGLLQRACSARVADGMCIRTGTEEARLAREEGVHRILYNHNLYCTICDFNNGSCEVHDATELVQIRHQKYEFEPKPYAVDDSNPFYQYDPSQCILCGRCVEACQNVQVTETLSIDWSLPRPRVLWDGGRPINESSCVSCGHCVTVCPCNALMEKSMLGQAGHFTGIPQKLRENSVALVKYVEKFTGFEPLLLTSEAEATLREQTIQRTKTVCTYCGVGCAFEVWTTGRNVLKIEPNADAPANGISTCIKGKFCTDFVNAPDRLTKPLIREGDHFREASWDEALSYVATRLREISAKHGRNALAFVSSSKTTNEECYLLQKLARAVFQTNNVDNCARYCQSPATKALTRTVGYGGDAGTIRDIEAADLVLIVGSHTATSHPVIAAKIKRQQKLRGQELIVVDLMEHEMARRADLFVRPKPGTDLVWVNAIARHILEQDWHDSAFIERRVHGLGEYAQSLKPYTLEYAEDVTGVPRDTLKRIAERVAHAGRVCVLWAMGLTQRRNGTDTCTAMSNLLLLTGNYGKPGTGAYPMRGHNNVQGSCDMGALYDFLPGYEKVSDDHARQRCADAWKVESLPKDQGLNNKTFLDAVHRGKLKGMYVVGEELGLVDANESDVQGALRELEFLVVQEIFFSTTAQFADVILPGVPSLEKDGTFTNTERRIQRLHKALEPLGDARPDWEILTDLAGRLGHHWDYRDPSEIMKEIASCTPMFAGVTYDRLDGWNSLCWPVHEDGTDTPLLYEKEFPFPDGKAKFFPVQYTPPHVTPTEEFDIALNNGRVLEHFHEGNLTYRCHGTREKVREAYIAISPELAKERDLEEGDYVKLTSKDGTLKTRVVISDEVTGKGAFMPVCSSEDRVNMLTSSEVDPVVDTPAYKEVTVKMEKLGRRGQSPLPPTHPRNGAPTPQSGIQVGQKWERPDYRPPSESRPPEGKI